MSLLSSQPFKCSHLTKAKICLTYPLFLADLPSCHPLPYSFVPATLATSATLLLLKLIKLISTSGPLHLLFPLPGVISHLFPCSNSSSQSGLFCLPWLKQLPPFLTSGAEHFSLCNITLSICVFTFWLFPQFECKLHKAWFVLVWQTWFVLLTKIFLCLEPGLW